MSDRREKPTDVVIVGGGIMGCACAWELARAGLSVLVLEKSVPGAEASSAAAGILGAQIEAHEPGPLVKLCVAGRARYAKWADALHRATGIDVEYREAGVLKVALDRRSAAKLLPDVAWQKQQGLRVENVERQRTHQLEPALARNASGVFFPDDGRIDPRRLFRALHVAAQGAGVRFRSGAYVKRVVVKQGRARGVALESGETSRARHVVVAAGSWTTLVAGLDLPEHAVRPARGQIVELASPAPVLRRVVFGPRCYLVPRDDGRTLVGSTLEFVGYRRDVTARAVRDLLDAALELCPTLAEATVSDAWSSFRPYTDDEMPLLGPTTVRGLVLATGHYRNGILLAPITGQIVSALVRGKRPPVSIAAFAPRR